MALTWAARPPTSSTMYMNRLVSKKIRLIPIPPGACARTRRDLHCATGPYLDRTVGTRCPASAHVERSAFHTAAWPIRSVHDTWEARLRDPDRSSLFVGGARRLPIAAAGVYSDLSHTAFYSVRDWAGDWRRNEEWRAPARPVLVRRTDSLFEPGQQSR